MSRVACVFAVLLVGRVAVAAELPPGAIARLGDDRFRAGSPVTHLAVSPDGKQFATVRYLNVGYSALTLWDAATGRPIREHKVNTEFLCGLTWGKEGARAIFYSVRRFWGAPVALDPNDFCVWDFTDPKAVPPLLPVLQPDVVINLQFPRVMKVSDGPECTDFLVSGDGRRVAVRWQSADKKKHAVFVYELKPAKTSSELKRVGAIDLGAEGADAVRFSANGATVTAFRQLKPASSDADPDECVATVWEVATGKPQPPARLPLPYPLVFEPDAREFVVPTHTETEDGYDLVARDTGKRRPLARLPRPVHRDSPPCVALSPSGRILVDGSGSSVAVIDLTIDKELGFLKGHAGSTSAVAISADGSCIATADRFGLIRLWSAKTLRPLNDAPGHGMAVEYAQLSPDGKRLLTWSSDDTVRLWDVATGKELRAFVCGAGVPASNERPTFTPDGTAVIYSNGERLVARDLQTGLEVPLPGEMGKGGARPAVFAPDGKSVLTWDWKLGDRKQIGTCEVWDWPGGKKRFTWKTDAIDSDSRPGFSADGAVIFPTPTSPVRIDVRTGRELPLAWNDERFRDDSLSALCSICPPTLVLDLPGGGPAEVIEAGTGKVVSRIRVGRGMGARPVALSPRGEQYAVASGGDSDAARLYESATGAVRRTFDGHCGARVLGFTPDGSKLFTAGDDHTVLVWDMRLQSVPLPDALKNETDAAKLWSAMAGGDAKAAYLAMARLAREPTAAVKLVKLKLTPATKADAETSTLDIRAIELLEALGADGRPLLKALAEGHAKAYRTQAAKRALERLDANEKRPDK